MAVMRLDASSDFDRLAEQVLGAGGRPPAAASMDAYRRGDRFFVRPDLPGVDPDSIDLTTEQNVLELLVAERAKPRRIELGGSERGAQTIEESLSRSE